MIFCPCCDHEFNGPDPWPDLCPECGARFEHEGEVRGEDWKPVVCVVQHGTDCGGEHER